MKKTILALLLLLSLIWTHPAWAAGQYNWKVIRGDSFSRTITWTDQTNTPVNVTGCTAQLIIKQSTSINAKTLFTFGTATGEIVLSNPTAGQFTVSLTPTQTNAFTFSNANAQLIVTFPSGTVTTLLYGDFNTYQNAAETGSTTFFNAQVNVQGNNVTIATIGIAGPPGSGGGGGGGTPGGTNGQTQYNNNGSFAGYTLSGDMVVNPATGVATVSKTNGVSFAPSATTDTTNAANVGSGTLADARLSSNVALKNGSNTYTGTNTQDMSASAQTLRLPQKATPGSPVTSEIYMNGEAVQVRGASGSPANHTLADLDSAQTLTNKSIASSEITGLAPSATTDTTNAANIGSGTLPAGRLPATVMQTNQANTVTTGIQDMSAATSVKVPTVSTGNSATNAASTAFVANTFAAPPALGSTTPAAVDTTALTLHPNGFTVSLTPTAPTANRVIGSPDAASNTVQPLGSGSANSHVAYIDSSGVQHITADAGSGGGFANPMTTLGDTLVEDATPTAARLAGNTTSTAKYLRSLGSGGLATAQTWSQIAASEISGLAASATTDTTNASNISSGTLGGARLPATAVQTNQANAYTTGKQDFSSATGLKLPVLGSDPTSDPGSMWVIVGALKYWDNTGTPVKRTVVYLDSTQTLTNKSIASSEVTGLAASGTTDTTNATNISSGTLADGRLSANVPLINANNAFSGNNTVPTQTPLNNSTRVASTAYVDAAVTAGGGGGGSPAFAGNGADGAVTKTTQTETTPVDTNATAWTNTVSNTYTPLSGSNIKAQTTITIPGTISVAAAVLGGNSNSTTNCQNGGGLGWGWRGTSTSTGGNGGAFAGGGGMGAGSAISGARPIALGACLAGSSGGSGFGASSLSGGNGGGYIRIIAGTTFTLNATGQILAVGTNSTASGTASLAGGGAGSGGGDYNYAGTSITLTSGGLISVAGGNAGAMSGSGAVGGGSGAGGYNLNEAPSITGAGTITVSAGTATGSSTNGSVGGVGVSYSITDTPSLPVIAEHKRQYDEMVASGWIASNHKIGHEAPMFAIARANAICFGDGEHWATVGKGHAQMLAAWNAHSHREYDRLFCMYESGADIEGHGGVCLIEVGDAVRSDAA